MFILQTRRSQAQSIPNVCFDNSHLYDLYNLVEPPFGPIDPPSVHFANSHLYDLYNLAQTYRYVLRIVIEAEYMAATEAVLQRILQCTFFHEIGCEVTRATIIGCDSNSAIKLMTHPVYYKRTKHIHVHVHFF